MASGTRSTRPARTRSGLVLLVLAALVPAACGSDDAEIEGVEWQLVEVEGTAVPEDVTPTLLLEGGQASGSGGCNQFSGDYTLDGDSLTFGPLAATLRACVPGVDEVEIAYFGALDRVDTAQADDELVLSSGGEELLRFVRP